MVKPSQRKAAKTETIGPSVGQRLRELRERVGVSQRELGRKSGQSAGAISAIELDKVSPSIETLKRLLDCLEETLADFFSVGTETSPSAFFGPENMVEVRLGRILYRQVGQSFKRDGVLFICTTVRPGSDTGRIQHLTHDGEIGFVLKGRIEVTINDETRVLSPGEGYVIRANQTIRIRNIFDQEADYVFVSSPSGFQTVLGA